MRLRALIALILLAPALALTAGAADAAPAPAGPPLPSGYYAIDTATPVASGTLDRAFLNSQCNTVLTVDTTPGVWYAFGTTGGSWRHDYPWGPHTGLVASLTGGAPWYRPLVHGDLNETHPDLLPGIEPWDASGWISAVDGVPSEGGLGWTHPVILFRATQETLHFRLPDVDCADNDAGSPTDPMSYNDRYVDWALLRVYFDETPPVTTPTLSGAAGEGGWYRSGVTVTLAASDPEDLPTQPASGVETTTLDGAAYGGPLTVAAEGVTTHSYYSTDRAGNVEAAHSLELKVDSVPPTSALTAPGAGALLRGVVTLTGTAADATSGVARVEVSTDGGATWEAASGAESWSLEWDTAAGPDGDVEVLARAVDAAGNAGTPAALTVQVDNTPPGAAFSAPEAGALLRGTVTLTGTAFDAGSGIARVEVSTDGGATWEAAEGTESWSLEWDTAAGPDGTLTPLARAVDAAGNAGAPAALTVLVDNRAPGLSITYPEANAVVSGPVVITGTASDEYGSGIARVEVSTDGGATWEAASGAEDWWLAWDTTLHPDGPLTLLARGVDLAGNEMPAETLPVTVDNTPPQVAIAAPGAGETVSGMVTVRGTAFDAGSGIARVEVSTDGGATWRAAAGTTDWTLDWDARGLPAGEVALLARAVDRAGHQAEARVTVRLAEAGAPAPAAGPAAADPAISKAGEPAAAALGEPVVWTITVANPGGAPLADVVIVDALPDAFAVTAVETPQGAYRLEGRTVVFELGTLQPGQEVVLRVTTVTTTAARAGQACNSAYAAGSAQRHAGCVLLLPDALPDTGGGPPPTEGWFAAPWAPETLFAGSLASLLLTGLYGLLRRRALRW